jgi:hypothetical protein
MPPTDVHPVLTPRMNGAKVRFGARRPVPAFQDERPLSLGKATFVRTRANGREAALAVLCAATTWRRHVGQGIGHPTLYAVGGRAAL